MIMLERSVGGLSYMYEFLKENGEFDLIGLDKELRPKKHLYMSYAFK